MNTKRLIRKTSIMMLWAMVLAVAITAGTTRDASAHHMTGYNDGKGCTWWHLEAGWLGYCYKAATSTAGYIWGYIGVWDDPWFLSGQYDKHYDYYYNYQGGFSHRNERATGLTTYPTACGWISVNSTCYAGNAYTYGYVGGNSIPANSTGYGYVGGNSIPSNSTGYTYVGGGTSLPSNPIVAEALSDIVDTWLAPNCVSSYNGC
jgi:hypothetical protein